MREKRQIGNLQGAKQLNGRWQPHQRAPQGRRGLVVGGLRGFTRMLRSHDRTGTTPCSAFERSPVATVRMRGITPVIGGA